MSIYCGFATRKLEEEYLGLIVRMLRLLCRKTTKHMKNGKLSMNTLKNQSTKLSLDNFSLIFLEG